MAVLKDEKVPLLGLHKLLSLLRDTLSIPFCAWGMGVLNCDLRSGSECEETLVEFAGLLFDDDNETCVQVHRIDEDIVLMPHDR